MTRKADEFLNGGLTDKHDAVPVFFFRTNEKWAALAKEQYFTTALLKEWHRVLYITFVCVCSADGCSRSDVRERGVVCHGTKAKQVQHHNWAAKPTQHECASCCMSGFEIALHVFYPIGIAANVLAGREAVGPHKPTFVTDLECR